MMKCLAAVGLFLGLGAAGGANPPVAAPVTVAQLQHADRAGVLSHIAARRSGATFVSRNGRMYGMDSDATITLAADNKVEVTEFGFAPQTYKGTYSVKESGLIRVSLRNYGAKWPDMYLYVGKRNAMLHPADQDPSFRMGGRGGAVTTPGMAPYWPFRETR